MFEPVTRWTITLPVHDNNGGDVTPAHLRLQGDLLRTFGGYSVTDSRGAWHGGPDGKLYEDDNRIYSVTATARTPRIGRGNDADAALEIIAATACAAARQECVYVTREDDRGIAHAFVSA